MALTEKLTSIADAIRGKTGGTNPLTLDQMATAIAGIQTGSGDTTSLFTEINNGTIENFIATEDMYRLRPYMFYGNASLKSIDLTKLNAPWLGDGSGGSKDHNGLIGAYCFNNCTALENIILPENVGSSWIHGRAFMGCTALKEFSTEKSGIFSSLCQQVFANCTNLKKVIIPNFTSVNIANVFNGCTSLELVDFAGGTIGASWFNNCASLKTLVIRGTSVTTFSNISAFTNTPFASGGTGGTVYVPAALIESYQTATNWSTLYAAGTCNFVAIEGSEYE